MLADAGWLLVLIAFPVLMIVAVIYAYSRRRRLTPVEKARQHEAVEELYEDTPADRAARGEAPVAQPAPRRASKG